MLIVGRMDGWLEVHWEHVASAISRLGHTCRSFDYRRADRPQRIDRLLAKDVEFERRRRRTDALLKCIREDPPDLVLLHNLRLDLARLRDEFAKHLVYWDIDGPAGSLASIDPEGLNDIDLILSVSKPVIRDLQKRTSIPIHYLANAIDTDFYAPGSTNAQVRRRFTSKLASLGKPTPRRVDILEPHAKKDLVLWGRHWKRRPWRRPGMRDCYREGLDLVGTEVVDLYRCVNLMLNVSREPFTCPATTLNLQVFQIPASAGCVVTEWVEELEEAFDPGVELLCFRSPEELGEMIERYAREPESARKIGEAGRRRCQADHSLVIRVQELLDRVQELPTS